LENVALTVLIRLALCWIGLPSRRRAAILLPRASLGLHRLREDRFLAYFTLEKEEAQIELPLRLIYPGRYQIPSISAMAMYAPTIQGTTAARWWKAPAF
jgi:Large extracellular alpha-helical protein